MYKYFCIVLFFSCMGAADIFENVLPAKKKKISLQQAKEQCGHCLKDMIKECMHTNKKFLQYQEFLLDRMQNLLEDSDCFSGASVKKLEEVTQEILDLQSFIQDATLSIDQKLKTLFKK